MFSGGIQRDQWHETCQKSYNCFAITTFSLLLSLYNFSLFSIQVVFITKIFNERISRQWSHSILPMFFYSYFIQSNLAQPGISVHCQVSVRSQYLVRLLSQCQITGGRTIYPPIEGLLPPTGIEPTPFQNSASKVPGLQVHATTPGG